MKRERILIQQNDETIKKIDQAYLKEKADFLARVNSLLGHYSTFDETFADTGITTAKYNDLLESGSQVLIDAAINKIKDQFIQAGITAPAVVSLATERTEQAGNGFNEAYNNLLCYLDIPNIYGLKFTLSNVKIENGVAVIDEEIDLEPLKDSKARQYIDTEIGYDLIAKSENLVSILNSINDILRANNIYNITELNNFGDFAKYQHHIAGSDDHLEVNLPGIYEYARRING